MQVILKLFKDTGALLKGPGTFFNAQERENLTAKGMKLLGLALLLSTFLLFVSAALSTAPKIHPSLEDIGFFQQTGFGQVNKYRPWNRLFFPLYWLLVLGYAACVRHLSIIVFGEKGKSFTVTLGVSAIALIPVVLLTAVTGVINNIFPLPMGPTGGSGNLWRTLFSTGVFLGALVWEAVIAIKGLRHNFEQNVGRAVLTWLSPIMSFFLLLILVFYFLPGI